MEMRVTGKVIVVGDNIDTDQIYPGCYLALTDPKEIGSHCLEGVSKDISHRAASLLPDGILAAVPAGSMHRSPSSLWVQKPYWQILLPGSSSGML